MLSSTFGVWIFIHLVMGHVNGVPSSVVPKKPHIIVIMADDLGWNDVSYHGSNQIPTPNIDALAYNGIILHNYYTQPVCTPSRASFLTGKYALRTGLQGPPLNPGETRALPLNFTIFPEHLRKLGYANHLIGKWHVGYHAKEFLPTSRGFDSFYGNYNGFMKYFAYVAEHSRNFSGYDLHHDIGQNYTVNWTPKNVYATDLFTSQAENIIAGHNLTVPLYLHLSHVAPHFSNVKGDLEVRDVDEVNKTFAYISNTRRRLFAGMMSALDESVGRVVQALHKKGMLDDSVIVFMSDNGAANSGPQSNSGSNYPFRGQKFTLYEGGVHVPAFVWSPMIKNTSRIYNGYFHVTDWLPTLYELAGGNMDDLGSIDGINQRDSIINGSPSPRDSILLNINDLKNTSAAIKGRFKILTGAPTVYSLYAGENVDDGDTSAPPYNVTSVTNSMAALAIANTSSIPLVSKETLLKLRHDNKIVCAPHNHQRLNCKTMCLFDILADPCEVIEVSEQHPEEVTALTAIVEKYRPALLPQRQRELDFRSLPEYEGGPWLPWLTVDGKPLPRPLSTKLPAIDSNETKTVPSLKNISTPDGECTCVCNL